MNFEEFNNFVKETKRRETRKGTVITESQQALRGLTEEVGELRQECGSVPDGCNTPSITEEIGDVLWYLTLLMQAQGLSLDMVTNTNVIKLKTRGRVPTNNYEPATDEQPNKHSCK